MRKTLRRGQGAVLIVGVGIVTVVFVFLLRDSLYLVAGALAGEDQLVRVRQGLRHSAAFVSSRGRCGFRGNMLAKCVISSKIQQNGVRALGWCTFIRLRDKGEGRLQLSTGTYQVKHCVCNDDGRKWCSQRCRQVGPWVHITQNYIYNDIYV
jgi:hypothetical protein